MAAEINADGVHIGQQDMSAAEARVILGPNKIIGLSIESMDRLYCVNNIDGISYVTTSAVFPSKTNMGLKRLEEVARQSKYPVTAIGGITIHPDTNIMEWSQI